MRVWDVPGSASLPAGSSTVEILLRAEGEETIIDLIHSGLPADELPRHSAGRTAAAYRQQVPPMVLRAAACGRFDSDRLWSDRHQSTGAPT
jgi:hypothetical protein